MMIFPSVAGAGGSRSGPVGAPIDDTPNYVHKNQSVYGDGDNTVIVDRYTFYVDSIGETIPLGEQYEDGGYIYTYGYYWGSRDLEPIACDNEDITNDRTDWKKMDNNIGWSVAVKDRSQDTYDPVYAVLNDVKVTYMTNCFANCVNLVSAPIMPSYVKKTENAFYNCKSLIHVELPKYGSDSMSSIDKHMFYGCTNLKHIYIPANITSIPASSAANSPFYNCANLKIFTPKANSSGWGTYWNYINGSNRTEVTYNCSIQDYCMTNRTTLG